MTLGPGSGLPLERTSTTGEVSSLWLRLLPVAPPGLNSVTRPSTSTASPTAASGADDVKTKSPSEVAESPSAFGSSKKKPFETRAVTIPGTSETA